MVSNANLTAMVFFGKPASKLLRQLRRDLSCKLCPSLATHRVKFLRLPQPEAIITAPLQDILPETSQGESTSRGDQPSPQEVLALTISQPRSFSVAPAEFYSDIAQALHRARATHGDKPNIQFWNTMPQRNLVLWLEYTEEAMSYHTLDQSMYTGSVTASRMPLQNAKEISDLSLQSAGFDKRKQM